MKHEKRTNAISTRGLLCIVLDNAQKDLIGKERVRNELYRSRCQRKSVVQP